MNSRGEVVDGSMPAGRLAGMTSATDPLTGPCHTDIVTGGWVARLPPRLAAILLLAGSTGRSAPGCCSCPGCGQSCWPAPAPGLTCWLLALFFVGAFLMRAAGCVVNDMWDRDIDRRVAAPPAGRSPPARCRCPRRWLFLIGLCRPAC